MQTVNLLSTFPYRPKKYLPAQTLLPIIAGWLLLLMIIYAVAWGVISGQQSKLNRLNINKHSITERLIVINKNLTENKQNIQTKKMTNAEMSVENNSIAFSRYLLALAKATPRGIWLTGIVLSNTNNAIALIGNTLSAAFIPEFLHNLSTTKVFSGKKFDSLKITKIEQEKEKNTMAFELSTKVGGKT